jgi:PilZ domain
MERRATKRLRVKLPMTVRWTSESAIGEARTESLDISSRGVYFFLPKEIDKSSSVEFVIVLPHEITLAEPVRVRCRGRVRRTEIKNEDRVGVVVQIERYEFLRDNENAA